MNLPRVDDTQMERWLGNLLRAGVLAAGGMVALGGVVFLWQHGFDTPSYSRFKGEPGELRSVIAILRQAFSRRGEALIQLGLVILIATPIARVALSAYAFARERDRQYVLITLIVLALLTYSLFGAAVKAG